MNKNNLGPLLWGTIIIGLGLGFLLDSLEVIKFGDFIGTYWPMIFIVFALTELVKNNLTAALILGVIGVSLQLERLDQISTDAWSIVWPLILVIIGTNIVYRTLTRSKIKPDKGSKVTASGIFAGDEKIVVSKDFRIANVNGIFGGAKINLQKAQIAKEGAVVDVLALFGGVEIILPKDTPVVMETTNLFGGSEDKRSASDINISKPSVKIQGLVMFGGLDIKS